MKKLKFFIVLTKQLKEPSMHSKQMLNSTSSPIKTPNYAKTSTNELTKPQNSNSQIKELNSENQSQSKNNQNCTENSSKLLKKDQSQPMVDLETVSSLYNKMLIDKTTTSNTTTISTNTTTTGASPAPLINEFNSLKNNSAQHSNSASLGALKTNSSEPSLNKNLGSVEVIQENESSLISNSFKVNFKLKKIDFYLKINQL